MDNLLNYLLVVSRIINSADFASVRKRALYGSARFLIFPGKATAVQDARHPRIVYSVRRYGFCFPVFRVIQIDRRSFSSFAALRHSNIVSCRTARPPVSEIPGALRPTGNTVSPASLPRPGRKSRLFLLYDCCSTAAEIPAARRSQGRSCGKTALDPCFSVSVFELKKFPGKIFPFFDTSLKRSV